MDDTIKRFKKRRSDRLKKRMDEEWITMHGTHVLIDDEGQVSKGPSNLKSVVEKSGGYKKKGSVTDLRKPNLGNVNKKPDNPSAGKYVDTLEKGGMKVKAEKGKPFSEIVSGDNDFEAWTKKEGYKSRWIEPTEYKGKTIGEGHYVYSDKYGRTVSPDDIKMAWEKTGAKAARDRMIERGKSGGEAPGTEKKSYEKIPLAFSIGGSQYATPEEKKKRREIISGFMNDAKEGDVYSVGGGIGSSGGSRFKVTKSRGKLALQWENSRYKPVEMSRTNVEKFLKNGATLVKRG